MYSFNYIHAWIRIKSALPLSMWFDNNIIRLIYNINISYINIDSWQISVLLHARAHRTPDKIKCGDWVPQLKTSKMPWLNFVYRKGEFHAKFLVCLELIVFTEMTSYWLDATLGLLKTKFQNLVQPKPEPKIGQDNHHSFHPLL